MPYGHTRSLQSFATQLRKHEHWSFEPQLPCPLHAFGHDAVTHAVNADKVINATINFMLYLFIVEFVSNYNLFDIRMYVCMYVCKYVCVSACMCWQLLARDMYDA